VDWGDRMSKCFVIMSFDEDLRVVFTSAIEKAASNQGYSCERVDSVPRSDDVPDTIVKQIVNADVVIVDLTHPKPNVYFELGIAFSTARPTICISQTTELPFDIRNYRIILYQKDHLDELRLKLAEALQNLAEYQSNPVLRSGHDYFDLRAQIEANLASVVRDRKRAEEFARFANTDWSDNTAVADRLVDQIRQKFDLKHTRSIVAISGAGSIGKSTFSRLLNDRLRRRYPELTFDILPTDAYMMNRAERIAKNITGFDIRAHDLKRFEGDLNELARGRDVVVCPYDHSSGSHGPERAVRSPQLLILEGIHALHPPVHNLIKYSAFIYATKFIVKELKFLADFMYRNYSPATAFEHSEREYLDYEEHVLPYYKQADAVVSVDGYWRYRLGNAEGQYKVVSLKGRTRYDFSVPPSKRLQPAAPTKRKRSESRR
jgi:uridine kinase